MKNILNDLLSLFFPRLCMICETPLTDGEECICLRCVCDLPRTGYNFLEENPTTYLFAGKAPVCHAAAFLHFEKGGNVQKLIHALKYHGNHEIGFHLGRLAALYYRDAIMSDPPDLLLPVPLHPKKQRKRGYNQSEWIAKGISSVLGIPINTTGLRRVRETDTQTSRQTYERWQNVQGIFATTDRDTPEGRHILLVDDVVTSGSTIGACAETLLAIPGVRVSVLALATA